MKFDIHNYMVSVCPETLEELKKVSKAQTGFSIKTNDDAFDYGYIKSLTIELSQKPEDVKHDYERAVCSLNNSIDAIRSMDFDLDLLDLSWHSVADSCWNIFHDKGFFVLSFKFHKKENPVATT